MVIYMEKKAIKQWITEDEKEHFPCAKEWWCAEGFFTTGENNKKWSFKADLTQAVTRAKLEVSIYSITLFDLDNQKIYRHESWRDSSKLESVKDKFDISYEKSFIKGSFPNYQMYFTNPKDNINLDIKYNADSSPYWVAQQITNGWLPWGLGYYRYGFIPKNNIKGTININNKNFTIIGNGYLEHIWGDFSFTYLSPIKRSFIKTISTYTKLIRWWINNQKNKITESIELSTDNRPPGYDWAWAVLENGWSFFYGNIIFLITEGPAAGILIFSKDGKSYNEFGNIRFKYDKMKYLQKYDFYYPLEMLIIATNGSEKFYLSFKNTSDGFEDIKEFSDDKNLTGFMICQVPCQVKGYYFDGTNKISICGSSKMEFHRSLSVYGHNSLRFDLKTSSNCFGINSSFNSHYFGKKFDINLQFLPKLNLKIDFNRINKTQSISK